MNAVVPVRPPRSVGASIAMYAMAVLAAIAALLLRGALAPFLGQHNPYHTAWLAVVFAAWYCGAGPAIITVLIDAIGIWYWFTPPERSLSGKDVTELAGMLGFVTASGVIIALGESTRRSITRRRLVEEELRNAHEELETHVRERTSSLVQRTAELGEKAALLDMANDAIFVKTNGKISYWNQGAERLYGFSAADAIGRVPGELLRSVYPIPLGEIESHDVWEGELVQTTRAGETITVASRWTRLRDGNRSAVAWMEINTDISARKRAEQAARRLSGRILTLQDDERRRLARGLHDSLGQYLAALKMSLDLLAMSNREHATQIADCCQILDRCLTETRTISHLLHPPLLDEMGFAAAASWFVDGFAQRSGIQVNLVLPENLPRMQREIEIALFRAVQEGLTNVHRHASSSTVDIRLSRDDHQVQLEIKDNGIGIPPDVMNTLLKGAPDGIGVAGMRERARELGGSLQISSSSQGTVLTMILPLPRTEEKALPGNGHGQQDAAA